MVPRLKLRIRSKIVVPFFLLLLFVGTVGTALVTARVNTDTIVSFEGSLLRAGLLSNDHLAVLEADRLSQLRAAIDTQGVPEAVVARNPAALKKLLEPIQANVPQAHLLIRVLNASGSEILTLTPPGIDSTTLPASPDLLNQPAVQSALAGRSDATGDKYVVMHQDGSGLMVYWVAPLRTDAGAVVGAVLLGQSLNEISTTIRDSRSSELTFYDLSGQVVLSSVTATPPLASKTLADVPVGPVRVKQVVSGHPYEFLVTAWRLRNASLGYLAIALRSDDVEASVTQIRLILVAMFVLAGLITLVLGSLLARRITRPIDDLVRSTKRVSDGDLAHRAAIKSSDEIGYLATSFNTMTSHLQESAKALEESYFASIEALARAIDARDPNTFGHSTRVAAVSMQVAEAMPLSAADRSALRRAALLHDIGKIGIEDRILRKPGPLTEEEWEVMRQHPVIGYKMLGGLHFLEPSLPGVLYHHERWDGKGYPSGLKSDNIPAYVRILGLADALDAMTSDRPYRRALSFEVAEQEIVRLAGVQFDPAVVDAFRAQAMKIAPLLMGKPRAGDARDVLRWLEAA
jgi:putative nucleotidyltransferase with HDIG domain